MGFSPRTFATLAVAPFFLASTAAAGDVCTQSNDNATVEGGVLIHCSNMGISTENQYLRRYSPGVDCGAGGDFFVTGANYAVEVAASVTGSQSIFVRAYSIPSGDVLAYANLTLLADVEDVIADEALTLRSVTFPTVVVVPAGSDLVLEVAKLTDLTAGDTFIPGGNSLGETGASFIAATSCGLADPAPLGAIGFPNANLILDAVFQSSVGDAVCGPNEANSTGVPATIAGIGSGVAADNDLTLLVNSLPDMSNGYFITSQALQTVMNPGGSMGFLCIASFTTGRYADSVLTAGPAGQVSLGLDLTNTPLQPGGPVSIGAGETWYWQYWYRDTDMAGMPTSNWSDALCVVFQ
ncbi:MAG: hypothetical protein AAGB93_25930 [Planctomycetota bacterium]